MKKVTLIGLGAMGVFFAPRLQNYLKDDFRVLANGERKVRLEKNGIMINGENYKFNVISSDLEGDPADLVIIAVKNGDLDQAIEDIRNQVGPNTQILSVLNGIESEERVARRYGWDHVLYSLMRVSIMMKNGEAQWDPNTGKIHFGEAKNVELSPRVMAIKELFDNSGIPYQIEEDMIKNMWFKFMANIGENMTCAMLNIPYGAFLVSEHANAIRRGAMLEVVKIANKLGISLGRAELDAQEAVVKRLEPHFKPSTLQDLENGKLTEVDMFSGKVIELGKQLGIETPINFMLYHGIKVHEEKIQNII